MSYEIARSISISKDTINIECRCNNLFPAHYVRMSAPLNFKVLLTDLDNGCLQPIESANRYKWSYIDHKLGDLKGEDRLKMFIELATAKEPKGKYVVWTDRGFLYKLTQRRVWFTFSQEHALTMGAYKAHVFANRMCGYQPKVLQI